MNGDERWELFECHRCGKCCTEIGLPFDPERLSQIADYLEMTIEHAYFKYYVRRTEDGKGLEWDDQKRTPCPFLKCVGEKIACAIYPVRPMGCRAYPFDTDGGRQGVDCPGAKVVYEKLDQDE